MTIHLHWVWTPRPAGSTGQSGTRFLFVGGCAHGKHYELPPGVPHWQVRRPRPSSAFTTSWSPFPAQSPLGEIDTYRRERLWADVEHPCVPGIRLRRGWEVFSCLPYRDDGWVPPSVFALVAGEPPVYEVLR